MVQVGLLSNFADVLFAPKLHIDEANLLIRTARSQSDSYVLQFALRKYGKRKPRKALDLVSALNLDRIAADWESSLLLARVLKKAGRLDEARHFAEKSVRASPRFKNVSFAVSLLRKMGPSATPDEIDAALCAFNSGQVAKTRKILALLCERSG